MAHAEPPPHNKMSPKQMQEEEVAKKLLERADKILQQVDESFIIKQRGHAVRPMPTFRPEEISLGALLGTGGFGIVNEIKAFYLDKSDSDSMGEASQDPIVVNHTTTNGGAAANHSGVDSHDHTAAAMNFRKKEHTMDENSLSTITDNDNGGNDHNVVVDGENPQEDTAVEWSQSEVHIINIPTRGGGGAAAETTEPCNAGGTKEKPPSSGPRREKMISGLSQIEEDHVHGDDHVHYDVNTARKYMAGNAQRHGKARYALKRLHTTLSDVERARGMIDLAVEAKYLATVWHPNIIKMRGMAVGPLVDRDFFIILDRLEETLDKRINSWYLQEKKALGIKLFGNVCVMKKKHQLHDLLVERMTVAYDLAAAFFYLHENRLVYRDIKPENIGFDVRGDVKVFDFGLCKSLSPHLKARDGGYGYRLTGRAGSLPYMAPEVARMGTYDTKCDVFSFAILLWEILSLRQAFKGMSTTQFMEDVVIRHVRLPVARSWPPLTRLMLPEAWDNDPRNRPDMKRVTILIRADLNDMTTDERILHRTKHMDNRSQHSRRGLENVDDDTAEKFEA